MFHKCWIVLRNGERPQLFANPDEMDDVWYIHMIFLVCLGLDVEVLCVSLSIGMGVWLDLFGVCGIGCGMFWFCQVAGDNTVLDPMTGGGWVFDTWSGFFCSEKPNQVYIYKYTV